MAVKSSVGGLMDTCSLQKREKPPFRSTINTGQQLFGDPEFKRGSPGYSVFGSRALKTLLSMPYVVSTPCQKRMNTLMSSHGIWEFTE